MTYWPRFNGEHLPMRMTAEWIESQLAEIRKIANDDQRAHVMEDALWEAVLWAIAEKRISMKRVSFLAAKALESNGIAFARWHA